ncbi:MAG: glycosyl hydrolase family 65 protein [Anaerohalosphaeraceae bacterium]
MFKSSGLSIENSGDSFRLLTGFVLLLSGLLWSAGDEQEPVRFVGAVKTSNSDYKTGYHDGQLPPAVGVHNYQILRANRSHPEWSDGLGWTYNHAPMLAYANGQFYCQYLNNPFGEHIPPGATMLVRSKDGRHWSRPQVLFPVYPLADEKAQITYPYMHQRMGFYIAPNGRFLTMGFYGSPYGDGIGRVVREIRPDDSLGPIYFIRVNDNWKGPLLYPLYTESDDVGFVFACNAFLEDKVRRLQWWEEDQFAQDRDDFYRVSWPPPQGRSKPGKAFCFYTRPDGVIVGFFKDRWVTITRDQGETWSYPVRCETLTYGGAKIWGQRTDDGRYALVYNPTGSEARHPLCVATGEDGIHFDNLLVVHGEVPPKRYWGREKRPGPQYVRGIVEGNGNPPGDDLWVVYSVSKEDIWIARIPVPVKGQVQGPVIDDFSRMDTGGYVPNWNIYSPQWCPVEIAEFPSRTEKSLMLKDTDPYDYAKAVRVFQKSPRLSISFRLYVQSPREVLDIEILSEKGDRLIPLRIDTQLNSLLLNPQSGEYRSLAGLVREQWHTFRFQIDSENRCFDFFLDEKPVLQKAPFGVPEGTPHRIEFRTGRYRLTDDVQKYKSGSEFIPGWDEPGADEPVAPAVFYLRDFRAEGLTESVLNPDSFRHYVDAFNQMDEEPIVNAVPNAQAWQWMKENTPFFECPDKELEEIYYFRWWTFRKHIKETPSGLVLTEFLDKVSHSGPYNTISCAVGHHIYEGTWLRDQRLIDDYARFWYTGHNGSLQPHFHKYSNWATWALYRRYWVHPDRDFLIGLLDAFVEDLNRWRAEKGLENGLFWQFDVRDGMEESISGSRKEKNIRPPLNCYLYANMLAVSKIAQMAGRDSLAREYAEQAVRLKERIQKHLWDPQAKFFKVLHPDMTPADVREAIGFIPWYFNLPDAGYEEAWRQLTDPEGFWAPMGLTTAERRHPAFRSHGVGTCEWDGAVWPFATSQTLTALANLLRHYSQPYMGRKDFFEAMLTYARSHRRDGKPYIGEYLDEKTGAWLTPDSNRSRFYNHSTFCDLVITGLAGLVPSEGEEVRIDPLIPPQTWEWFCLDRIPFRGRSLTILWDQTGLRYGLGKGLSVYADGCKIAASENLEPLTIRLN